MLNLLDAQARTTEVDARWYVGTVFPLWNASAAQTRAIEHRRAERWRPCKVGNAWRIGRRLPSQAGRVDFHGGNPKPLEMKEAEATAFAAALNRRLETWLYADPARVF